MIRASLMALAALSLSSASLARPMVFISDKTGHAWWTNKPIARPMSKTVDGVTVEELNEYRSAHEVMPEGICFAEALETDSIVGLDRKTQEAITATLAEQKSNPFYRSAVTADGKPFTVRAAVFQTCDGRIGGAILVIGADRKLEHALFHDDDPLTFLFPAEMPALVGAGGCFKCGDWSSLYYDVTRKRFYWEYEGD